MSDGTLSVRLEYRKLLDDPVASLCESMTTWRAESNYTHDGTARFILWALNQELGYFLTVNYLPVNQEAC